MPTINQTINKIYQFAELPTGWHYGDGGPIDQKMIERAHEFLLTASGLDIDEVNAFPGIDGQIELIIYNGNLTTAFVFEEDNTVSVTEESKCEIISDVYGLTCLEAEERLWKLSQKNQTISDSFISSYGTAEIRSLEAGLLAVLGARLIHSAESHLLQPNVYYEPTEQFASTSDTFTALSLVTQ